MTPSGADSSGGTIALDWDELAGLDRIEAAYTVGDHAVIVETTDGREIRITALYDRARDNYVAEFERRSVVKSATRKSACGPRRRRTNGARPKTWQAASKPPFCRSTARTSIRKVWRKAVCAAGARCAPAELRRQSRQ